MVLQTKMAEQYNQQNMIVNTNATAEPADNLTNHTSVLEPYKEQSQIEEKKEVESHDEIIKQKLREIFEVRDVVDIKFDLAEGANSLEDWTKLARAQRESFEIVMSRN